jgi:DNA invertase Pin-like site-specific DNA recombinase
MALIGYARVSTRDQNPDSQTDALTSAGCDKIFIGHASGVLAKRPALDHALDYLRHGDTLAVVKLDRLGRSVRNLKDIAQDLEARGVGLKALSQGIDTTIPGGRLFLHMLAAIAELEHDLIVERTQDGLVAARVHGRVGGGRTKMTVTKATQARAMYDTGRHTVQEIAETFNVSPGTIHKHLEKDCRKRTENYTFWRHDAVCPVSHYLNRAKDPTKAGVVTLSAGALPSVLDLN